MRFRDRTAAGAELARRLVRFAAERPLVLGLPRGGVPVATEIADRLGTPLDVVLVRKVGVPGRDELAAGAVGEGGVTVPNLTVLRELGLTWSDLADRIDAERTEVARRAGLLRPGRPPLDVRDRVAVLVDDGIATGSTMIAAIQVVRRLGARRIVVAVPVAPPDTLRRLGALADEVVCLRTPARFLAVGRWYHDFRQVSDDEVRRFLAAAGETAAASAAGEPRVGGELDEPIEVRLNGRVLAGHLTAPAGAAGVVIVVGAAGRPGPGDRGIAAALHDAGVGTVLLELVDETDAINAATIDQTTMFELLTARLAAATAALRTDPRLAGRTIGYLGSGLGTPAALCASTATGAKVATMVFRGGRADLAERCLPMVDAPTLFLVGERDRRLVRRIADVRLRMRCETELIVVPGGSHLLAEPGALPRTTKAAARWFLRHLVPEPQEPDH